ncbi:MAG: glycoside hydrolase family 16 protein [Bacteroidota bacterium]
MRMLCVLLFLLVSASQNGIYAQERELVWSDEFDYSGTPDKKKWGYDLGDGCPRLCGWGNNELQFYTNKPENVRVENGILIIEALQKQKKGKGFTSARMVTKGRGDWKYGYFEIKAKLPTGRGTWPAIWMLPTEWKYGGWPDSGEIDIMEHVGFNQDVVHGTVHIRASNDEIGVPKGNKKKVANASSEFHVYAIDWREDKIDFFIDGEKYHTFENNGKDSKSWPFDQTFHLILNIAVGGNWGGEQGVDYSVWPQRMEVDYVRVYE